MNKYKLSKTFIYLLSYSYILVIPLLFIEFDYHSILFIFSLFLFSISLFSIKKTGKHSLLRMGFLIFPCFFYILYLIPISVASRGLTTDDILAVLQTNVPEAINFLIDNLDVFYFLILLGILFSFIFFSIEQNKYKNGLIQNQAMVLICLIIGSFLMYFNRYNSLTKPIYEAIPKIQDYRHFYSKLKKREQLNLIQKATKNGIYVVVIGESQNRNRMSVYGYTHHYTTPFLSKMKQNKNWFFFDNVYSCHTHTIPVLTYALTSKNNYNKTKLKNAYSVMDILQEFNTYWISNQKPIGYYGEPITEIGLQAKKSIFSNKSLIESNPYDEHLLKYLPKEEHLKDISVIFIHLMGNHARYIDRYPKSFSKWNDHYDNSILYNDYILKKIYEHFSSMKNFMSLIYFSDHADDVLCKCHDSSIFTWDMTKIPFFIYLSENYIHQHPQKSTAIKEHLHTAFTNDMLFDTLLGLLDITDERFYIPQNDLFSFKYNHTKDDLSTLHGKKLLSSEIEINKKFWLHRVNSPEKLKQLGCKYSGLEMDIIYHAEHNDFENSHNEENLQLFPLKKTLETYKNMSNKQSLWFDFKNLNNLNKVKAEKRLSELIKQNKVNKDNIWVESKNYNALEYFTKKGWKTSYYFPYYNFQKMSSKEIEEVSKLTEEISFSSKVTAISFAGKYYDFIKNLKLNPQISLLTWFEKYTLSDFIKNEKHTKLLQDPQLEVILIKELGKHHR